MAVQTAATADGSVLLGEIGREIVHATLMASCLRSGQPGAIPVAQWGENRLCQWLFGLLFTAGQQRTE